MSLGENKRDFSVSKVGPFVDAPDMSSLSERELLLSVSGDSGRLSETLPFSRDDTTAGSESELQVAVIGKPEDVDLPQSILSSAFFSDSSVDSLAQKTRLEELIQGNADQVWENSWVQVELSRLEDETRNIFHEDLLLDRSAPGRGRRSDFKRFQIRGAKGQQIVRIPISYLIKLASADFVAVHKSLPEVVRRTGLELLANYVSDNISPETVSFYVVPLSPTNGMGLQLAKETAKRFLLTSLLLDYANDKFGLRDSGQTSILYCSPSPPVRQRELSNYISGSFYRELFCNPCLSGWDNGEEKHEYMKFCHKVLTGSKLNIYPKLINAGLVSDRLPYICGVSDTSLANNGVHISLGSRRLGEALADPNNPFGDAEEKRLGDLVIKCVEYFLPLFVGTYSGAPRRLGFSDLRPELAMGFLPHQLDHFHLRLFWQEWLKKARVSRFGLPLGPTGAGAIDRLVQNVFGLSGDLVPDNHLVDYYVSILSTENFPALDGKVGNVDRLRSELGRLGMFDERLSLYMLYKLREFSSRGFTGFEGRHYSLFETFAGDMGRATSLQNLVTALAFKYIAQGKLTHEMVPDCPFAESERRQVIFGAAVGLPKFYVKADSRNTFLREILGQVRDIRKSRDYPDFFEVGVDGYREALCEKLETDAADLIDSLEAREIVEDLKDRVRSPDVRGVAMRLSKRIANGDPASMDAKEFNYASEVFYRGELKNDHLLESLQFLAEDLEAVLQEPELRGFIAGELGAETVEEFFKRAIPEVTSGSPSREIVKKVISFLLVTIHRDKRMAY